MAHLYDRETRYLSAADGTRIAYHLHLREGPVPLAQRPLLLLTNGIGTTENFWRYLVDALAVDFCVAHWDYRGHGGSEPSRSGDYRIPTQADDLLRVMDDLLRLRPGAAPPVHVAFSMGVAVLLEAYRRRPDRVPAMVLLSGAPESPGALSFPLRLPGALTAYRAALDAMTPLVPLFAPGVRALLRSGVAYPVGRALGLLRRRAPREDVDQFMAALAQMDPRAYWDTLRALMAADASDVLPTVTVPTLVVAAANDWLMPRRQVDALRERLPHAQFVEIQDAGHAGLIEAGGELAEEIRQFLGRVTSLPRALP